MAGVIYRYEIIVEGVARLIYVENLILGAGISGLAAAQKLHELNKDYCLIEKADHIGGLCSSFKINDFVFDSFIHLSFTTNEFVRRYFDSIPYIIHIPNPMNYYHGMWIKHPAQNNLYPLSEQEKALVLNGLYNREKYADKWAKDYDNWLRYQFGDYFAEHFSLVYTKKYWAENASNMETKWVGNRIYQPSLEEIKQGMNTMETPVTYYAKEMRYPKSEGFEHYLKNFTHLDKIRIKEEVIYINPQKHIVSTNENDYKYKQLYSSIPLPEYKKIICNTQLSDSFFEAISRLHWTGGYLLSFGCTGSIPRTDLWDYVYDEDILVSRYYSPSLMSKKTVPEGCYSLQAEIYTKDGNTYNEEDGLLEKTIEQLDRIGALRSKDIIVKDIRFVKYCNILFDHKIYESRERAISELKKNHIIPIGRFGEWAYYWSDQSFLSGYNAVELL